MVQNWFHGWINQGLHIIEEDNFSAESLQNSMEINIIQIIENNEFCRNSNKNMKTFDEILLIF